MTYGCNSIASHLFEDMPKAASKPKARKKFQKTSKKESHTGAHSSFKSLLSTTPLILY